MARGKSSADVVGAKSGGRGRKAVVIYPEAWQKVRRGMALGLYNVAAVVHGRAASNAVRSNPDVGLPGHMADTGGAGGYLDHRKVAGVGPATSNETPGPKPTAFASFEFPAHLIEIGSVHNNRQPFLIPAVTATLSAIPGLVKRGMKQAGL